MRSVGESFTDENGTFQNPSSGYAQIMFLLNKGRDPFGSLTAAVMCGAMEVLCCPQLCVVQVSEERACQNPAFLPAAGLILAQWDRHTGPKNNWVTSVAHAQGHLRSKA